MTTYNSIGSACASDTLNALESALIACNSAIVRGTMPTPAEQAALTSAFAAVQQELPPELRRAAITVPTPTRPASAWNVHAIARRFGEVALAA